jgi:hypothetical protein
LLVLATQWVVFFLDAEISDHSEMPVTISEVCALWAAGWLVPMNSISPRA